MPSSHTAPSRPPRQVRLKFARDKLEPGGLSKHHALAPFMAGIAQRPAGPGAAGLEAAVLPCPGCLNLRGNPDDARFLEAVRQSLGMPLPLAANRFIEGRHRAFWLGPDEWLVVAGANADAATDANALAARLRENLAGLAHSLVELTGGLVALRLRGPRVRNLLAKGCTLDFHPRVCKAGQCAQTRLAKASALIATLDEAPTFELFVRASLADYLALWLDRAGREYGLQFRWQAPPASA